MPRVGTALRRKARGVGWARRTAAPSPAQGACRAGILKSLPTRTDDETTGNRTIEVKHRPRTGLQRAPSVCSARGSKRSPETVEKMREAQRRSWARRKGTEYVASGPSPVRAEPEALPVAAPAVTPVRLMRTRQEPRPHQSDTIEAAASAIRTGGRASSGDGVRDGQDAGWAARRRTGGARWPRACLRSVALAY